VEPHALVKHQARVGRVEEVLVVGPSKRDLAVWSGRTRQNKLVHFVPERGADAGDLVDVEITDSAPHWMRGRIVADPRSGGLRPGRDGRRRIPVTVE
jgi:tRNA-2-methylthio-N6-dimethylallyladenosine synthase